MESFSPVGWKPPRAPDLDGHYAANTELAAGARWDVGGIGPEDVVLDASSTAYTGLADGRILRMSGPGSVTELASVGGRPLGIELHGDDLVVCNADLGLQLVSKSGSVMTLVDTFEGRRLKFTNNAAVTSDGTIYFSDTSQRWSIHEYVTDMLEGQSTGRVFARSPDGDVRVVLDGLAFANGVALSDDESTLYVAETARYRIHAHHLTGPQAGTTTVFVDNLPCFPDNLTFGNGVVWAAGPSPRQAVVDLIAPRPWLRHITHRLPDAVKPKPVRHGMVFGFAPDGSVKHNLQDSMGTVAITTSARWHDGQLYVGTLTEPYLVVLDLT